MAASLTITTLGQVAIALDNVPLDGLPHKAKALLIYLACRGEPQPRTTLVGMLWPEHGEKQAMTSLRVTLTHLRKAVGPYLSITRQIVAMNQASAYQVDLLALEKGISLVQHPANASGVQSVAQLEKLSQALAYYQGDFLSGFMVSDSQAFEEWITFERERLRMQTIAAMQSLVAGYMKLGRYREGLTEAMRLLHLDPLREESHRQLMRLFAHRGQRSAALQQFENCRQILDEELGVEPTAETVTLHEQIRTGAIASPQQPLPPNLTPRPEGTRPWTREGTVPPPIWGRREGGEQSPTRSSLLDWGDAPDVTFFYGRQSELATLSSWLVTERCRLAAILGMGGQGKTALAAKLVHEVADQFEYVIWRSLLNAPPFSIILRAWLHFLSDQTLTHLPENQDEQVNLLFDYLRQKRCLLILDNAESILLSGARAGDYRAGYAEFDQFIRRVGESEHQSCLLLTSREKPRTFMRLQRRKHQVRSFALSGVGVETGQQILQMDMLTGSADEVNQLIARYSGNPLALMLVADTIDDLFAGDIAAFLAEESFIFEDIQDVLDQQFTRLSELEREILIWLTVERTPTTLQTLQENLLHTTSKSVLTSTTRSLQRRSLVQKQDDSFRLQNVIIEYVTERFIIQICQELAKGQLHLFQRHALIKAQTESHVHDSQERLILQPVCDWLISTVGKSEIAKRLQQILHQLKTDSYLSPTYAAGNLLNLLLALEIDLRGYDFAQLEIRQAYLRGFTLPGVNFSHAEFRDTTFTEDFKAVKSVAFSPDGTLLAAGMGDGTIRLWDVSSGQPARVFEGHTSFVWELDFNPDGTMLASASSDMTVRLWDVQTGQPLHCLTGHQNRVWSVAFSPAGHSVASGGDSTVRLWDTHTGKLVDSLQSQEREVVSVAFSPDGTKLASGGTDAVVYLWNLQTRQMQQTLSCDTQTLIAIAFSPNGTKLASGGYAPIVHLWDLETGQIDHAFTGHETGIRSLAFSPDGTQLASGGRDGMSSIWDTQTGRRLHVLRGHDGWIASVAFSPDGELLASGADDSSIRLWQPQTGQPLNILQGYDEQVKSIAFNSTGTMLVSSSNSGNVRLWELQSGRCMKTFVGHTKATLAVAITLDDKVIASSGNDRTVRVWDLDSGLCLYTLRDHTDEVQSIAVSPQDHIMASAGYDGTVRVWNIETGQLLARLKHDADRLNSVAFNADGSLLAAAGSHVYLWEMKTYQRRQRLDVNIPILDVDFDPNNSKRLVHHGRDNTLFLWDVEMGRMIATLAGHTKMPEAITFSRDGSLIASGGLDNTIRLWDVETKICLDVLQGHKTAIYSIAFSPDGRTMASSSYDAEIRIWDLPTRHCVKILTPDGPYAGMNIFGATGLSTTQRLGLKRLGAVEEG